jgi:hypothetical protein
MRRQDDDSTPFGFLNQFPDMPKKSIRRDLKDCNTRKTENNKTNGHTQA